MPFFIRYNNSMNPQAIIAELRHVLGHDNVLADPSQLMAYECDGFPIAKSIPLAVAFPTTTQQVARTATFLAKNNIQIVPRGSGTGLTGASVAFDGGVIVCVSKMTTILEVDISNRTATVEPGVRNLQLTEHVNNLPGGEHLHFAPDPSSQRASTIGGNAATNAGGLHTLKYGVTTNHVLGVEIVLPDGSIINTRTNSLYDTHGPDLTALICGSEGTLGIITKVIVRLTPRPVAFRTIVAIFDSTRNATQAVADVIAAGVLPAALEMMDGSMVRVIEDAFHMGFPQDAAALLLIELDGVDATLDQQMHRVVDLCNQNHASDVQCSSDPKKRAELWSARKQAFGAIGRISPSYCTQDACVPRSTLPDVLEHVMQIGEKHKLKITNVFHAGDGNVHPILLFDEDDPEQVHRIMLASHEIIEYCLSVGGVITGEHGVGVEKLPLMQKMFDPQTLTVFDTIKKAFDATETINAGKLIPSPKLNVDLLKPTAPNIPGGAM